MRPVLDITSWYAITLGAGFISVLLYRAISRLVRFLCTLCTFFLLKHLIYPYVYRRRPLIGGPTRIHILCATVYVAANGVCMAIGVRSSAQLGTRAGLMSTINLIPLMAGSLSAIADYLGISLRTQTQIHKWIGAVTALQGLVHTAVSFVNRQQFKLDSVGVSEIIGSTALALICLLSSSVIRRALYEFFLQSHFLLSLVLVVALWRHSYIAPGKTAARRYLGIGACVWIFFATLQWIFRIFRNFAWHRPRTKAELSLVSGALLVSVTIPRPWRVKAGQYIYLSVPRAGFWSIFQRHPFMISSWNEGADGLTVELLVKPRRGFTQKLIRCTEYFAVSAFIDGPFGVGHDFSEYGTVLMFATGIGVAGHLPYINELVQGYIHCKVKTRHIALVWLIDKDGEQQWAKWLMDKLLEDDQIENNIEVYIYVRDVKLEKPIKTGKRITTYEGEPDVASITWAAMSSRKGKMVISVCTDARMSDSIRHVVSQDLHTEVRLVELEFQPPSYRKFQNPSSRGKTGPSKELEFQCKGDA